jgi:hypothetical protein
MTQRIESLRLGDGRIWAADRFVGQVSGASIEQAITEIEHDTNFGLEYFTDHILTIKRGFTISWMFGEVTSDNANMCIGMPGYSGVPWDRSLPGPRMSPNLVADSMYVHQFSQPMNLYLDPDGIGNWSPLMHPICNPDKDSLDLEIPEIAVNNIDYTGTPAGYVAWCVTGKADSDTALESLPSNIVITPYSNASDDVEITVHCDQSAPSEPVTDIFNVYRAPVTKLANGQYQFDGPFELLTDFEDYDPGTAAFEFQIVGYTGALLACDSGQTTGSEPPIPVALASAATGLRVETEGDEIAFATAYSWPEDFQYEVLEKGAGQVKLSPGSSIPEGLPLKATFYYNTLSYREAPLASSGVQPIIPITLDILFPDNESRMIWTFFKARVLSNFTFASGANDWQGMSMSCRTIDASNKYPKYGYGYLQIHGPIADSISEYGNRPYGVSKILGSNQTSYA